MTSRFWVRAACSGTGSRWATAISLAVLAVSPSLVSGWAVAGEAQQESTGSPSATANKPKPVRQLRLSDWLLQQPASAAPYPLGLSLRLPEEVPAQTGLKLEVVSLLAGGEGAPKADRAAMKRLRDWVAGLPVTGRVPVANADGRWLQMNPAHNPILTAGYSVVLPQRPRTLTVITSDGSRCVVVHSAGREAGAYIDRCRQPGGGGVDWAWIAQPDGRVQRSGIALWNEEKQDEPAPGAWIWAPGRHGGWPDAFSERFIRFLASQGPAPDPPEGGEGARASAASAERNERSAAGSEALPAAARGATSGAGEGMVLGGGMSLGLSEAFLAESPPESPPLPMPHHQPLILRSEVREPRSRNLEVSAGDWGTVGLLQNSTARMREPGYFSLSHMRTLPYTRGNIMLQPFDWMEAGFRYTEINNRAYSGGDVSGQQSFKDKSIDVKFLAWKESAYLPQVAVGFRDVGGTGLFSGEYVVASKRTGDFDWSGGIEWGYRAAGSKLRNPLSSISSRFDDRSGGGGSQGGEFGFGRYFGGPAALFAGVQYQTPWERLTLKLEYDPNDYQNEPLVNKFEKTRPVNFAVVYRAWRGLDLTAGVERGNKFMFGATLHGNFSRLSQPKLADPKPVAVADARPSKLPDWSATAREFKAQTDWNVRNIEQRENDVRVVVEDAGAVYWRYRIDRGAAVLHRDAPASVDRFTLAYRNAGVDIAEHVIDRQAWVDERTRPQPPSERREAIVAQPPSPRRDGELTGTGSPLFEHGLRLSYGQTLGAPEAFLLWQLGLIERVRLNLRDDTWIQGNVRLRIADNYEKYVITGPSNLPRVRTFLREYLTTSTVTIPNLQLSHVGKAGQNHFYSAYGGYLEEMFAGVGGEWLYRPFGSRLAFGVDVNAVRQREFEQRLGFRDYRTVTGHATMYWDTGWNDVMATVHAGRYLANDVGATLSLTKQFKNGVTMGAFVTRTDASAEEFGEGGFDKGVFVSVPFDAIFMRSSRVYMSTLWRPLTRDGGVLLTRPTQLYALTGARSERTLWSEPAPVANQALKVAEHRVEYKPQRELVEPYTRVTPKLPAAEWERPSSLNEHRLLTALYAQSFRSIKVSWDPSHRVIVEASNDRLRPIGRAAGRAARTALLHAPLEARGISITLLDGVTQQARYEFFDLQRLQRYFDGDLPIDALKDYVKVEWLNPAARVRDPFAGLDDLNPEAKPSVLAPLVPDTFSVSRVANDYASAAVDATKVNWVTAGAVSAGAVLASSLLDKTADRQAEKHADGRWLTRGVRIGNAIPWVGFAAAGALALDGSDPRRSRTGYAAVEAGAGAFAVATGLKYGVGRARPTAGKGRHEFNWLTREDANGSFPSRHTAVAWALATPFALEYDMPWLYGVAALTNFSRVGGREHWVSDTVASSLIGYGLGRLFWQSGRDQAKGEPKVLFDGSSLGFLWDW